MAGSLPEVPEVGWSVPVGPFQPVVPSSRFNYTCVPEAEGVVQAKMVLHLAAGAPAASTPGECGELGPHLLVWVWVRFTFVGVVPHYLRG